MSEHDAADPNKRHPDPEDEGPDRRDDGGARPADSPPPPGTGQGESPGKRVDD